MDTSGNILISLSVVDTSANIVINLYVVDICGHFAHVYVVDTSGKILINLYVGDTSDNIVINLYVVDTCGNIVINPHTVASSDNIVTRLYVLDSFDETVELEFDVMSNLTEQKLLMTWIIFSFQILFFFFYLREKLKVISEYNYSNKMYLKAFNNKCCAKLGINI